MSFLINGNRNFALLSALVCAVCCQGSLGSELREMLTFSTPTEPIFESTGGTTTITVYVQYTNVSTSAFVIDGLAASEIRAPEAIGVPDLTASFQGLAEIEAVFPTFDLFNSYWWSDDTPQQSWTDVVLTFNESFPLRVEPGESFTYHRVMTNGSGGAAFGPATYGELVPSVLSPEALASRVGESLVAIDLNWHLVPAPGSASVLALMMAGLVIRARVR